MIPVLFEAGSTSYSSNGIGRLIDCISCIVTEERNGMYELEMKYPITGARFHDLSEDRIVLAIPSDGKQSQPFMIYKITKPLNGEVTVYAAHISYLMKKITVLPYSSSGGIGTALADMNDHCVGGSPFTLWTDKSTTGTYAITHPMTQREVLGGEEGSILDRFGAGEWDFDRFEAKLYQHRGADHGVTLRYGKNITDMEHSVDSTDVYTGVVPYWTGSESSESDVQITVVGDPQYSHASDYATAKTIPLDLSDSFESRPTVEQLNAKGASHMSATEPWNADRSITVDFVALWQTDEYADIAALERVSLCDTVTVVNNEIGVSEALKVIRTEYNVLTERYDKIELGKPAASIESVVAKTIDSSLSNKYAQKTQVSNQITAAIGHASELISGGLGGYVVIGKNGDGEPEEILVMDTDDAETAVNVIRINKNGIGFSTSGYNGPFTNAWTIDGKLNASFITAGELDGALIKAGSIIADAIIRCNNSSTPWKTEIIDGKIRTYGTKDGDSHVVGNIVSSIGPNGDEYDRYSLVADACAKGITFGQYSSDSSTSFDVYYVLNLGTNPDGYTQRHVFFGNTMHDGRLYGNIVTAKKLGISATGDIYGTERDLYCNTTGYVKEFYTDKLTAVNLTAGRSDVVTRSDISSGAANTSWSSSVSDFTIAEAGTYYIECAAHYDVGTLTCTGNFQLRVVNSSGTILGEEWRDARYSNSNCNVICRVSGRVITTSANTKISAQLCQNTGKTIPTVNIRWNWIRIK